MRWVGHVAYMGDRRGACRLLIDRPEGKGLFRRRRYRYEENIKMDFQELGWVGMDWIDQAQDMDRWRVLVNVVVNLWVP
jgi:hypothetical protein